MIFKRIPKTPEEKKQLSSDRKLLILSGVLLALGFPPFPFPFLLPAALVPFLIVIERRESFVAVNRAAFLMAFTASLIALYWVGAFTQGKDPYLMTGGILLFFVNPIPFTIATSMYYLCRKYISRKTAMLSFPFFWVAYEYIYSSTDWSFPWLNLGNGICNFSHFIQIADIIGAYGLSLIIVYINVFLFISLKHYQLKNKIDFAPLGVAVLLLIIPIIYGAAKKGTIPHGKKFTVAAVQPNLDPYDKWSGMNEDKILGMYMKASDSLANQNAELLLWPETALPVYLLSDAYAADADSIYRFLNRHSVSLLTGIPDLRYYSASDNKPPDVKYNKSGNFYYATYNGIYLMNGSRRLQRYGKRKLVPFGERVPFVDAIPLLGDLMRWGVGLSGWNVGQDTGYFRCVSKSGDTVGIGAVVCYESIYPEMTAASVRKGAQFLAVVTNDSWYGNTSGPYQHRDYAKLRCVENRRYFVRAANGGISCIIDAEGNLLQQTKMYERTVLKGDVELLCVSTFFSRHPQLIPMLTFAYILFLMLTGISKKINSDLRSRRTHQRY